MLVNHDPREDECDSRSDALLTCALPDPFADALLLLAGVLEDQVVWEQELLVAWGHPGYHQCDLQAFLGV